MRSTLRMLPMILLIGCASRVATNSSTSTNKGKGDDRTKTVTLLDENTFLITDTTDDKTYGYDKTNPVKVGGSKESSGPKNERRYLNGLLGPNGEEIKYFRAGSCCAFKTPNGMIDNTGLLDRYRVFWKGSQDTLNIYINMYDKGDLKIPVGLTAKKIQ